MELLFILVPIFVFVLLKMVLDQRAQAQKDRVRLIEEALKSPNIDRQSLESLTFQLTGQRPVRHLNTSRFLAIVLAAGWIALFAGLAMWIAGGLGRDRDLFTGGIITALVGFGLVTYPFALRELEARRQA
ncbi:MAG: hypothetical protein ACKVQR_08590 [Aquabacterium sp.]